MTNGFRKEKDYLFVKTCKHNYMLNYSHSVIIDNNSKSGINAFSIWTVKLRSTYKTWNWL